MRYLNKLVISSLVLFASNTYAHSDGHGDVGVYEVVKAAQFAVKTLTFKDIGMSIKKLDASWNSVPESEFKFLEATDSEYIIRVNNSKNNQTLYLNVNRKGQVVDVKDVSSFQSDHGHSH